MGGGGGGGDVLAGGGLKIKIAWGRESYISSGIWGGDEGSDVFHWILLSIKDPPPHIPNDTANNNQIFKKNKKVAK